MKIKGTRLYWFLRRTYCKKEYLFKQILNFKQTQKKISEMLENDKPIMITRIGGNELRSIREYLYYDNYLDYTKKVMINNTGFFPTEDKYLDKFAELNIKCIKEADLIGVFFNNKEGKIIKEYNNRTSFTQKRYLDPMFASISTETNWTRSLKNKTVLVIHPFQNTIEEQFKKMSLIFPNREIEYDFNLLTYKAVQSIGGNPNYETWFEAYEKMCNDLNKIHFDIALIGAGSYGLPLAYHIKKMRKKALHIGGSIQILFGIKGKRWDEEKRFNKYYNQYWVRPSEKEKPKNYIKVENGCYW